MAEFGIQRMYYTSQPSLAPTAAFGVHWRFGLALPLPFTQFGSQKLLLDIQVTIFVCMHTDFAHEN